MSLLLSEQDYYSCINKSLIADYDYKSLIMLYQPIVGSKALSLYFTFLMDASFHEWVDVNTHLELSKKTSLSLFEIGEARKKLEALSLIKTYRKLNEVETASYIYELYAPKTPEDFFNDPLFLGLLEASIGEKSLARLRRFFKTKPSEIDGYVNLTTKFNDVYGDLAIKLNENNELIMNRKEAMISSDFDEKKFIKMLVSKYAIVKSNIKEDFVKQIKRLALLFNYNEEVMAMYASKNYHPDEEEMFDLQDIYNDCKSSLVIPVNNDNKNDGYKVYEQDDIFAKKVNLLNDTAPIEYFRLKSNNTYPSPSDINIINILSRDYNLSNGVINVIIDTTLDACNQDFPRAYCEKIAAKLKRLNVTNALEAMNALKKRKAKKIKETEQVITASNGDDEIDLEALKKEMEDL